VTFSAPQNRSKNRLFCSPTLLFRLCAGWTRTTKKRREATFDVRGRGGQFGELVDNDLPVLRPLRSLQNIFLMAQPPLFQRINILAESIGESRQLLTSLLNGNPTILNGDRIFTEKCRVCIEHGLSNCRNSPMDSSGMLAPCFRRGTPCLATVPSSLGNSCNDD